jgi:hypothetical protein
MKISLTEAQLDLKPKLQAIEEERCGSKCRNNLWAWMTLAAASSSRVEVSFWIFDGTSSTSSLHEFSTKRKQNHPKLSPETSSKYVNVWRIRPASAFIGREDRSRRSRDGPCDRYVQQVRAPAFPSTLKSF